MTIPQPEGDNKPANHANGTKSTRVAVALSGGVDSAVSAARLQEQGYDVTGYFMKNWTDVAEAQYRKSECPWLEDYEDAQRVAEHLGIVCRLVNLERDYRDKVFQYFIDEYKAGRTPNPDVLCNTEIKFKSFLEIAKNDGFDLLATGHYANVVDRTVNTTESDAYAGFYTLERGADPNKDQSYFIHHLDQQQLGMLRFPIGDLQKPQVRELAQKYNLPVANKKDSQGLCFVGEIDFPTFLETYIPHTPGRMITVDGEEKGEHRGLEFYTIGQRYGLDIGGDGPYFVVEKQLEDNTLIICRGADHPSLESNWFTLEDPFWTMGNIPQLEETGEYTCSVKVRYRSPDVACTIKKTDVGEYRVELHQPERAVTPGQFAVFYDDQVVLGGAVISAREINL